MKKLNRNEKIFYTILQLNKNNLIRLNIKENELYNIEFKNLFLNYEPIIKLLDSFFINNENELKKDNEKYYFFIDFYYIKTKNLFEIDYLMNLFIKEKYNKS